MPLKIPAGLVVLLASKLDEIAKSDTKEKKRDKGKKREKMKVLFSQWMREIDFNAISKTGIPSIVLMENASQGSCPDNKRQVPCDNISKIIVLAGPGNNGGDGIATGGILAQWGYNLQFLFLIDPSNFSGDPLVNFNIINELGIKWVSLSDENDLLNILKDNSASDTLIIDAIFGTGINKDVKDGKYFRIIET